MLLTAENWSSLGDELRVLARSAGTLRLIPNKGNAGDALIGAASWQLFDDLDLHPVSSTTGDIRAGDAVIYAGGGNLVPEYQGCREFLEQCLRVGVAGALILPHTVRGHVDVLARLDGRFVICARDDDSLAHLRRCGTGARVITSPDLALRMDVGALQKRYSNPAAWVQVAKDLSAHGRLRSYVGWRLKLLNLARERGREVRVLRTDAESRPGVGGERRWDISGLYVSEFMTRSEVDVVSRDLLTFLWPADRVVTNRLHIGIAAALNGSLVTYLDNSYGKVRAVYRTSMMTVPSISFADGE